MKILGIDPGTATTGYGLIEADGDGHYKLLEFGWIKTSNEDAHEIRLTQIYDQMSEVVKKFKPDQVAMKNYSLLLTPKPPLLLVNRWELLC